MDDGMISEGVKDVYEYSHPIINNALAVSASEQQGKEVRRFATLADWYDVINDYEFQSRCPIILKNSHRNKHFTFACHLKNCPFKILLSYSSAGMHHGHAQDDMYRSKDEDVDALNDGAHDHKLEYHDVDDPQVTAAIAAAVAAVGKDSSDPHNAATAAAAAAAAATNGGEDHKNLVQDTQPSAHSQAQAQASVRPNSNAPETIRGPFVVTKIIPYHDHPVQDNLSLDKFVLTKIPRILQNELNFDDVLETLVAEGASDGDVAKFRVSEYVEHSGLLDIIKARYDLMDSDITKKFLSQIARRVTTYKARFVLRKKKYGIIKSDRHHPRANPAPAASGNRPPRISRTRRKRSLEDDETEIAQEALKNSMMDDVDHQRHIDDDDEEHARKLARLGEDTDLHSGIHDDGDHSSTQNAAMHEINPLASIDEVTDDKLPREVAEQLRLLSSHFKDVENQNLQDEEGKKNSAEISDENIQPELRGQ
ncbi:ARS-binding factor 1 [Nakaseomyces glabratus]|uniref:ARS-binding factor 1 n=1 Tax=Candida glabrata TaxID=5478 RepID=A0A0W0CRU6_CANGB|nr:BAF1 / ABF1 chromatin reorganising factor [Nakaseomyces glabratus]KAH7585925.1 BAF1 / ABF1 chromatin reorganising factor [Nakaseomyces glabratus]KAH7588087.1 BAF1 / ABF1 chromatin reorganising factor [Nakaseomyces glabratus]KAH7597601.1 BAF1 / ABF1 chromatin reorganising factor [Nakaseomyces glabratus]KAH7612559.1 BAF1 / ABF1 chromatin reorganising factor [Nakaseomyces glabratus]